MSGVELLSLGHSLRSQSYLNRTRKACVVSYPSCLNSWAGMLLKSGNFPTYRKQSVLLTSSLVGQQVRWLLCKRWVLSSTGSCACCCNIQSIGLVKMRFLWDGGDSLWWHLRNLVGIFVVTLLHFLMYGPWTFYNVLFGDASMILSSCSQHSTISLSSCGS